jgi:hypothetical protein
MPLTKYIKQPLSPSLAQYTDAELRKIEASIFNLVQSVEALESVAYEEGTFVLTGTGFSGTAPTGIVSYRRIGQLVSLFIPTIGGTSNATSFTLTGLPSHLVPQVQTGHELSTIIDNSVRAVGAVNVQATGIIVVYATINNIAPNVWTAAGTKTIIRKNVVYPI